MQNFCFILFNNLMKLGNINLILNNRLQPNKLNFILKHNINRITFLNSIRDPNILPHINLKIHIFLHFKQSTNLQQIFNLLFSCHLYIGYEIYYRCHICVVCVVFYLGVLGIVCEF